MNEQQLDIACATPKIDSTKNRAAVSKHYHANLEENRKKKREYQRARRAALKVLCANRTPDRCTQPEHEPEPEPEMNDYHEEPPAHEPQTQGLRGGDVPAVPATVEEVVKFLDHIDFKSDKTRLTYAGGIRRLFYLGGCDRIVPCLKKHKQIISKIEHGIQPNGKEYSTSAKKGTLQAIVFVMDNILPKGSGAFTDAMWDKLKTIYEKAFKLLKTKNVVEDEEKQAKQRVPSFKDYIDEITALFPDPNGKEQVVARLYSIFTVRDNFKEMKIINSPRDDDKKGNFILIPRNGNIKLFINTYKTAGKNTSIHFTLSIKIPEHLDLIRRIRAYAEHKKLKTGDFLFGKTPLSSFISEMNKRLGYHDGGVNLYRHIRTSEILGPGFNYKDRNALAEQMGHSILTAQKYARQLIVK